MLDAAIGPEFGFRYSNYTPVTPPNDMGTAVTPGATNAEGSWTQIASGANIAADIYGFWLNINGANISASAKNMLVDVGVDPAGGSSFVAIVSNLVCGSPDTMSLSGGREFYFPLFIPAGSSVAVRGQGSSGTASVFGAAAQFFGRPQRPEVARAGSFSETIGTITNSNGTSFTPGSSGAEGSWASLGTTAKEMWWWQVGVQIDNTTMNNEMTFIDLAYGDVTNKVLIIENLILASDTGEAIWSRPAFNPYKRVPAGSEIFVRGSCSGTPAAGYNAVAVGVGG